MEIKSITKYEFKGIEYSSLKEVKEAVHNIIGEEVLDRIGRVCELTKHADWFKVLDVLCNPEVRKILLECYNITYTKVAPLIDSSDVYQGETEIKTNILDYK